MRTTNKVVMLPSKEASHLYYNGNKLDFFSLSELTKNNKTNIQPQHLYITSNEEIKVGDWFYFNIDGIEDILQVESQFHLERVKNHKENKKIIAITDKSLGLPQIPESFIQAYIKSYNERKPITEVLVEYETPKAKGGSFAHLFPQLKLRPDNTIIISQAKTYSREEVRLLICKYALENSLGWTGDQTTDKWIEQNL